MRGFIWDIPILIFAYVLLWGPTYPDLIRLGFRVEGEPASAWVILGIKVLFDPL